MASLPIFRDTNVGTYDADAIPLAAFLGIPGRNASAVDCLVLRYFPNDSEDFATVFQNDLPILATSQGLHGERCRFNHASVTRDPTVCKKGPAILEASDHFLVLVLILRATIPMRQSRRLLPCDHPGDDGVPGDLWVPGSIALPLLHCSTR